MTSAEKFANLPYEVSCSEELDEQGEIYFVVYNLELPGCMGYGYTREAAYESEREARLDFIHAIWDLKKLPLPLPKIFTQNTGIATDLLGYTFYIAGRLSRVEEFKDFANKIGNQLFTSSWIWSSQTTLEGAYFNNKEFFNEISARDLADLDKADALILFTEPSGSYQRGEGRFVEFGYALAKGKKIFIIGDCENCFCCLDCVKQFDSAANFINLWRQLKGITQNG